MAAPQSVLALVERFDRNRIAYRSEQYNEARLRIEFLNPFFKALGWDVDNKHGYAESYKDVIYEDAIKIGGATKAPDYCFRIGGTRKFFVEAKKPAINLKDASSPAFQLRRYAWSAKLPLSILTDFEEFAIYDCRIKPDQNDKAATARIMYLPYTDYPKRWEEITSIFSREAILKGSFDTFAEETKGKRGTAEVDTAFLQDIESWREMLAHQIALHNKQLTQRELNFAVQMTIDRIIFLRICEDRGIEEYERLRGLLKGPGVYKRLCHLFQEADDRYNSGLFHFQKEKDVPEPPDTLTPHLVIDDKPLKQIITQLYYPDSPYEFSALPADVLGQVYEQFLGKVIRLTPSHQVTIEEKPEVRKAGGVYYTPTFIVNYIVQNTLSRLLEGKKPGPRGSASKIKIVDPACGSGSFLIVAYQYLLDWHRDRYVEDGPEKHRKELYQGAGGQWLLTTQEKKRILLNNIYGVDIDPQAVEVTKLSLLLKVLEGESNQSLVAQLSLFKERALPDLDHNIKCGNSLISSDFYQQNQLEFFDMEEQYRINAFDWGWEFAEIIQNGGFDAVIGNPPWIFTKYVDWGQETKDYIQRVYLKGKEASGKSRANQPGKINLYAIFLLKGLSLLKNNGQFGFIVPNTILRTTVYDFVRRQILEKYKINRIVDLKANVFNNVTASTVILLIEANTPTNNDIVEIIDNPISSEIKMEIDGKINQLGFLNNPSHVIDIFSNTNIKPLLTKIEKKCILLSEIVDVLNGIATNKNMEGVLDKKANDFSKPILFGKDVSRYFYQYSGKYINYQRDKLLRARNEKIFLTPEKLIMQRIGGILITAYDDNQFYTFNSINNLLPKSGTIYSLKYILGVLNSSLMRYYYIIKFTNKSSLTVNISKTFLDMLPVRKIEFNKPEEKELYDKFVKTVDLIIELKKKVQKATLRQEKDLLSRQIAFAEKEIDRQVYELYGLTEEEINMVEGKLQDEQ